MRSSTLLIVLAATVLLFGCQKEKSIDSTDPDTIPPSNINGVLKAKIDGAWWTANSFSGATRMAGLISIGGGSLDKKMLDITLVDSGVHRYILGDEVFNAGVWIDSTESAPLAYSTNQTDDATRSGGEVNITAINTEKKTISGTFSFKVYRFDTEKTITITEGSFTDLKFATSLPPAAATDTFRVKINGTSWTPASIYASTIPNMGTLSISGTSAEGTKSVGIMLPSAVKPGTYTFDSFNSEYMGLYNPDADPEHSKMSESGTLTILEHNTTTRRIRGTFAFHAQELLAPDNTAEITEGYFSVKYP